MHPFKIFDSKYFSQIPVDTSVYYFAMIVYSVTTGSTLLAAVLLNVIRNKILLRKLNKIY